MKFNQLDKNRVSVASLTAVISVLLGNIMSSMFSFLYYMNMGGLISMLLGVIFTILINLATFVGAYNIVFKLISKNKPNQKDVYEMGITVALAKTAIGRLLNMFGFGIISSVFLIFVSFIGAYFLCAEEVEEGNIVEKTTLYRKEKIVQKGSQADTWLMYVFMFVWGCGIIFTWGGFIVRPRSQAPAFYMIGIAFLALAILWTKQKINESNIESYAKIVLPANWPTDCSYEKYKYGLATKGAVTSGGIFGDKNMKFYNECVSNGIKNLDTEFNLEKAMKVAEKQKIKEPTNELLKTMFTTGKEMVEKDEKTAQIVSSENALNTKRIQELHELADCMKYYGYSGMEKRQMMLKDLMAEARKNEKDTEFRKEMMNRTLIQKEHDWATHGGIASGIAGPAAGIATAIDIQAKNARIREQNAQMMPYVAMMAGNYNKTAEGYRAQYNQYAADLKATSTKLVSKDTKEEVMNNIIITDSKYTVSNSGAVTVEAKFGIKPEYRIYDSIKPTIDGCVAARLMKDGKCEGSAYFVFPVDGIIANPTLKAICTKTTDPKATYTLEFDADNVWAMERL